MAPKILTPVRQVKVRAGMPLNFEIEYVGEPNPEVEWSCPGKPGLPEKIQIDNRENLNTRTTSLFIPAAKRSESGQFNLKLKNDVGSDQATIEIIVQGKFVF